MSFIRLAAYNLTRSRLALAVPRRQNPIPWRASFSAPAGLTKDVIETRVLDVLKGFEKVNPSKVLTKPCFHALCDSHSSGKAYHLFIIHGRPGS